MTTHLRSLHAVAIPVTDQDAALGFYRDVLGLTVSLDEHLADDFRWVEVALPDTPVRLALVRAEDGFAAGRDTGIRLMTADAAADHATLTTAGVDVGDLLLWDTAPPMFALRDPDGNTLYVMEPPA
ncbi:catechol 2,3-dioxygenase-like lactoylglutathione lyase family enzyme [Isoptericola jiangsuensis]|uniref:Catechol 2,3-dioxygenase-like lactoylglutathione lyase family enzyme n=1 Tax=Isoptericola jiangsuensis TaxID=548579 RepID=A0A2A9ET33_9MICO|nr:VOC family protein [Isoptericola jiangsuensis]PFG42307.1 catechol 2,3-dioxygenase-like lactoylglutathione lyase family enzyme [Isoptericola jiangsuensis]